jgi:hypothetical protein
MNADRCLDGRSRPTGQSATDRRTLGPCRAHGGKTVAASGSAYERRQDPHHGEIVGDYQLSLTSRGSRW